MKVLVQKQKACWRCSIYFCLSIKHKNTHTHHKIQFFLTCLLCQKDLYLPRQIQICYVHIVGIQHLMRESMVSLRGYISIIQNYDRFRKGKPSITEKFLNLVKIEPLSTEPVNVWKGKLVFIPRSCFCGWPKGCISLGEAVKASLHAHGLKQYAASASCSWPHGPIVDTHWSNGP